ncbi:uncharacterized protein [Euphorbia lathyris]|uniref:uncharacterized protein isoform X1 n=1 Tax=Euphorbia lathyris TaxID=212925 RepID=UPI0033140F1F
MNTLDEEKHVDRLCGFIFLCNGKTKPECYMYRVFGLPEFRKDVVENIKPGMQLFLFDFEVKLLYGVYEATSVGEMNVEPTAFGGKFPAQVSFRICKDCFPLPESSFKHAIKENYEKGKFKQELNDQQVRSLLSLFRPFTLPTSVPGPLSLPIKPRPETFPPPGIDNLYQARPILLSQNDPSATVVQLGHNLSVQMPQHLQRLEGPQHAYYGSSANVHPSVNKQTLPAPTMPYMENPYAARMQHVRASRVLENTYFDQSALSPEPGSYGTMVNTGYVHHVTGLQPLQVPAASHHYADAQTMANAGYVHHSTELQPLQVPAASHHYAETQTMANAGYVHHSSEVQTLQVPAASHHYADAQTMANAGYVHHSTELQPLQVPAASHHYAETQTMANAGYVHHSSEVQTLQVPAASHHFADTQQAYTAGNPSYRNGPGMEASYSNQHPGLGNVHYHIPLQRNQDIVVHPENAVQDSSLWWPAQNGVQNHSPYFPTTKHVL